MLVVTDLTKRRKEKRWTYQRRVLRAVSLEQLRRDVVTRFFAHVDMLEDRKEWRLLDACMDIGVDAYLLGAEYARFGYYGEKEFFVLQRCASDVQLFIDDVVNQCELCYAEDIATKDLATAFIYDWWRQGFTEGKKCFTLHRNK
ncbi:DUF2521 family protein [Paenalkalicoccus suaedae]|uniref:DUF2521 family protein n=1 Tax=Paenalkalicoccus suaedae TaxID=2592382 RepID=A0A859FAK4_9BACI|nr:DUF2521 family protein [Paenalkalicoccus suaedae]QKS69818.1 DUF2521 family protein [Paenalkalicoccus suaedae]